MARAPYVLAATVAGTAALVAFHPHHASSAVAAGPSGTGRAVAGSVVQTRYGPVQVRITVQGARVTEVAALQLPQNDPRSSEISGWAPPLLRQEALTAQKAAIDSVSGATYTSDGYRTSLAAALAAARI